MIKTAFYVNGNQKMGTGHIQRTLILAGEFEPAPDIYYDAELTESNIFGNAKFHTIPVRGNDELLEKISSGNYNLLINDTLDTSAEYMKVVRSRNPQMVIVNFDDVGAGTKYANLVLNPFYEGQDRENILFGEKYFVLKNIFSQLEPITIKDKVQRVFVCFGGADPADYTYQFAKAATREEFKSVQFVIVMGGSYRKSDKVRKLCEGHDNILLCQNINNIHEYMLDSDLAICSRGITGYELGALGIPTMALAENEVEDHHTFIDDKNGYRFIGRNPSEETIISNLSELIFSSSDLRHKMQEKILKCDLRNGTKRAVELIKAEIISSAL